MELIAAGYRDVGILHEAYRAPVAHRESAASLAACGAYQRGCLHQDN